MLKVCCAKERHIFKPIITIVYFVETRERHTVINTIINMTIYIFGLNV